jgi:hypothetical protein
MIAAVPLALLALFFLGFLRHGEGPDTASAGFAMPKAA